MTRSYTGVIEDPRPKKEKKKDWNAKELLAGKPVVQWIEKDEWKGYEERNQHSTNTCVPQSVAKLLEINEKYESGKTVVFSATKAYADRTNSGAGSWLQQMLAYACADKYTTEERLMSQGLDSDKAVEDLAKEWNGHDARVARRYAGKSYLTVDSDPDTIAYWISQRQGISALFFFTATEWKYKKPRFKEPYYFSRFDKHALRHAVAIVDYGLIDGEKYFKVEDSAHFGGRSVRYIHEDWILERCYAAGLVYDKPNTPPEASKFQFKKNLWLGMRNNADVVKLQDRLKQEGFFPMSIPSTGNYFEITRQAVEKYQKSKGLSSWWPGRFVWTKTRSNLNQN